MRARSERDNTPDGGLFLWTRGIVRRNSAAVRSQIPRSAATKTPPAVELRLRGGDLRAAFTVAVLFSILAALHAFWFAKGFADEGYYWLLAQNLVRTGTLTVDGTTLSATWPPLVPWLLTPLAALGVPFKGARIFFILFYFASGMLTAGFLRRLLPDRPALALVGTALVLANPLYFFAAGNIYPQLVLAPLFIAALWVIWHQPVSIAGQVRRAVAVGLLLGVSLLSAASALFSFVPLLAFLAIEDLRSLRRGGLWQAYRAALACAVAALVIAPYMYRNHVHVHPGAYLTLNSGINLLLGNSPTTTPTSGVDVAIPDPAAAGHGGSEFTRNKFYSEVARDNLRSEPGRYALLYVRKFLQGFSNSVVTATHGPSRVQSAVLWSYMLLIYVGVYFAARNARRIPASDRESQFPVGTRPLVLLIVLVVVCYVVNIAGYAVYFTRLRFRLPVDLALTIVGAIGWYLRFTAQSKGAEGVG